MDIKETAHKIAHNASIVVAAPLFLGYCLVKSVPVVIEKTNDKITNKLFS